MRKSVILARGLGKRLRAEAPGIRLSKREKEIASLGLKALMPLAGGKALLLYILEGLSAAGFDKFCIVIGEEHGEARKICGPLSYDISFAIQKEALGTADAVLAAEAFAGSSHFLSVNSDNLYPERVLRRLGALGLPAFGAFSKKGLIENSNFEAEKVNTFAVAEIDEEGCLSGLIEKPESTSGTSFISMNAWLFSPRIFEACRAIAPSKRGEFEITDAVVYSINKLGEKYRAVKSDEGVLDLSSRRDIASLKEALRRRDL